MGLPKFQSDDNALNLLETNWKQILDPVIAQPFNSGVLLQNVPLTSGVNFVNHKLPQKLTGWILTRQRGQASVYDLQDTNNLTSTLKLQASSGVNVDIFCF